MTEENIPLFQSFINPRSAVPILLSEVSHPSFFASAGILPGLCSRASVHLETGSSLARRNHCSLSEAHIYYTKSNFEAFLKPLGAGDGVARTRLRLLSRNPHHEEFPTISAISVDYFAEWAKFDCAKSRKTCLAGSSSSMATKREWPECLFRELKWSITCGLSQRQSFILAAISPRPNRPAWLSDKLPKGHSRAILAPKTNRAHPAATSFAFTVFQKSTLHRQRRKSTRPAKYTRTNELCKSFLEQFRVLAVVAYHNARL